VSLSEDIITDDDLLEFEQIAAAATPGPWYVSILDDASFMNLVAITTVPMDSDSSIAYPEFDASNVVSLTLVQQPRYASVVDERWDENAAFIAECRRLVPLLIKEVRRYRKLSDTDNGRTS
jgi:hypothetical protein